MLSLPIAAGAHAPRLHAGVPLRTSSGAVLGSLCVVDFEPRELSENDLANLEDLAAMATSQLELRLKALRGSQPVGA